MPDAGGGIRPAKRRATSWGSLQRLEPGLSFGHVRKRLREFAGLSPRFQPVNRAGGRNNSDRPDHQTLGRAKGCLGPILDLALGAKEVAPPRDHRGCLGGRRSAGGAGRQRLVHPSLWSRRVAYARCARTDIQRFADMSGVSIRLISGSHRSLAERKMSGGQAHRIDFWTSLQKAKSIDDGCPILAQDRLINAACLSTSGDDVNRPDVGPPQRYP